MLLVVSIFIQLPCFREIFHQFGDELFLLSCWRTVILDYFQLLYTRCLNRASNPKRKRGDMEDQQILTELRDVTTQLPQYQKQIQRFFELVLDVDQAGRDPQKQAWNNYYHNELRDPELFKFRPIPVSFEPTEEGRCSPVLYSASIPDMIDYSLRTCVERDISQS